MWIQAIQHSFQYKDKGDLCGQDFPRNRHLIHLYFKVALQQSMFHQTWTSYCSDNFDYFIWQPIRVLHLKIPTSHPSDTQGVAVAPTIAHSSASHKQGRIGAENSIVVAIIVDA